ncbi:hypothetical protein LBWT_38950 [Leptolyngbya boryana IAM M-101]|nr:hypothetical protein LBWT_38950 [Leptolyngbya boryana IAM M-101]BAS64278.1 hypothetical protein LBDG_38950 [Leptolyngbya boryana dg5]
MPAQLTQLQALSKSPLYDKILFYSRNDFLTHGHSTFEAPVFEVERDETGCRWIDVDWNKYPLTGAW